MTELSFEALLVGATSRQDSAYSLWAVRSPPAGRAGSRGAPETLNFLGLTHLRQDQEWEVSPGAAYDEVADARDARCDEGRARAPTTSAHPRTGALAWRGRERLLCLPRRANQHSLAGRFPNPGCASLVPSALGAGVSDIESTGPDEHPRKTDGFRIRAFCTRSPRNASTSGPQGNSPVR
jgi:hypothetical protein